MNGTLTAKESAVWADAWERHLAAGDDHGYAAYAADEAVLRERTKARKRKEPTT